MARPLTHTNHLGVTFYLHQGKTKTGKPRYFVAKTVGEGAISKMPAGYEFTESINAVVSVRRVDTKAPRIPDTDLAVARAELARHRHLQHHRVEAVKGEILVYEPVGGVSSHMIAEMGHLFGLTDQAKARLGSLPPTKYEPVMKFVPSETPGEYDVHRMTYRGQGGWSWPLDFGRLDKLVKKYLRHVGTEAIYELM